MPWHPAVAVRSFMSLVALPGSSFSPLTARPLDADPFAAARGEIESPTLLIDLPHDVWFNSVVRFSLVILLPVVLCACLVRAVRQASIYVALVVGMQVLFEAMAGRLLLMSPHFATVSLLSVEEASMSRATASAMCALIVFLSSLGWLDRQALRRRQRRTQSLAPKNSDSPLSAAYDDPLRELHILADRHRMGVASVEFARILDSVDNLARFRKEFHVPDGATYMCGNSLGLQPKRLDTIMKEELDKWKHDAVDGHFRGSRPWFEIDDVIQNDMSALVGAKPSEVAVMNSLTVNVHLMLVPFYRPTKRRYKILLEQNPFPSDMWALRTHVQCRGFDPDDALLFARPREGERLLNTRDILDVIEESGDEIALVFFAGVHFMTGQAVDFEAITAAGHSRGCIVGFDLAHAVGNLDLQLHDWNVDFAAWCTYKYMNSGPGAIAGIFVHDRWTEDVKQGRATPLLRFGGWWGNIRKSRFSLKEEFDPTPGAAGFQVSNPSVLSMCGVIASLEVFREAGFMGPLRQKSLSLTAYLEQLIKARLDSKVTIITPADWRSRGCQLSIVVVDARGRSAKELKDELLQRHVVVDDREPDLIRIAPTPLYNSFQDCVRVVQALEEVLS